MDALPSQPSDGRSKWNGLCGSLVLIQLEGLSGLKIIVLLYLNVYNRLLNSCGIKLESPTNDFACPSLQFTMSSFGAWRQTRAGGEREREEEKKAKPEPPTTAWSCYSGRGVSYVHFLFAENWALSDSIVTGCFLCAVFSSILLKRSML